MGPEGMGESTSTTLIFEEKKKSRSLEKENIDDEKNIREEIDTKTKKPSATGNLSSLFKTIDSSPLENSIGGKSLDGLKSHTERLHSSSEDDNDHETSSTFSSAFPDATKSQRHTRKMNENDHDHDKLLYSNVNYYERDEDMDLGKLTANDKLRGKENEENITWYLKSTTTKRPLQILSKKHWSHNIVQ